jgi:hypothetical protein
MPRRRIYDSPQQEEFCDLLGRHLLVPSERARAAETTATGLLSLQENCDVSLEVAARALSDANPKLDIAIWFGPSPDQVRLQWSSSGSTNPVEDGDGSWLEDRQQLVVLDQS